MKLQSCERVDRVLAFVLRSANNKCFFLQIVALHVGMSVNKHLNEFATWQYVYAYSLCVYLLLPTRSNEQSSIFLPHSASCFYCRFSAAAANNTLPFQAILQLLLLLLLLL